MAKLPVVRSAWSKLSVVYTDTKGCHPSLKIICEALENSVAILSTMATDKLTLAIVKLEPQSEYYKLSPRAECFFLCLHQ